MSCLTNLVSTRSYSLPEARMSIEIITPLPHLHIFKRPKKKSDETLQSQLCDLGGDKTLKSKFSPNACDPVIKSKGYPGTQ